MLKELFVKIGLCLSYVYPTWLDVKLHNVQTYLYTGWIKRNFKKMEGIIQPRMEELHGGRYISIDKGSFIHKDARIMAWDSYGKQKFTPHINIGKHTQIGRFCMISAVQGIDIGDNVAITARTLVLDNVHGEFRDNKYTFDNGTEIPDVFLKNVFTRELASKGPVKIENNVHIGENSVILPGVTIGHNSVISANSVVARSCPPFSIVAGNPAQIIITFGK